MIGRLVILGASGDLSRRFLLPAIGALRAAGRLPERFEVVGAATEDWDDDDFRRFVEDETVAGMLRYQHVDVSDADSVAALTNSDAPLAVYLALPQGVFATAVGNLVAAGLPAGTRIALEKPFGDDFHSARELNWVLHRLLGDEAEAAVFRVDHVLGMATVHRLIALREDPVLAPLWDGEHVEEIEVLWEETLALEGRGRFYDRAGALKDVVQNHMLQLLAIAAMEPSGGAGELRDQARRFARRPTTDSRSTSSDAPGVRATSAMRTRKASTPIAAPRRSSRSC